MRKETYIRIKRLIDTVLAGIGLVIAAPVMAISCIAIMIDDPKAKPFYSQVRAGKDGKPFTIYKLRTMCANADKMWDQVKDLNEMDGPVFKIKDDPRITKVGKFLRKTNLDELPQLINIFRGDMALVGPRPPLPREVEQYEEWHKKRLAVTPGLTCIWQIAKNRNDISFDDWVKMDIEYIEKMSFWLDLKILLMTAGSVLKMTGR